MLDHGALLTQAILIATIGGSALWLGAVQVSATLVFLCLAALGAWTVTQTRALADGRVPLPAVVLAALAAYTFLQAVPLPFRFVERIAPKNAEVWRESAALLTGHPPAWASISMDSGASFVEASKWFMYACVFVSAAAIGARRGAIWGALTLFGSSVMIALLTLAHGLAGAQSVYGLYTPTFGVSRWHLGPLLNPNNLAGFLNLGGFCGAGVMTLRRTPIPQWVIGMGVATVLAASVASASRGGVVGVGAGMVTLVWALESAHRGAAGSRSLPQGLRRAILGSVFLGALLFAILGVTTEAARELTGRGFEKLKLARWVVPMVREHPWFGIGRGAFETVFPAYKGGADNITFTHAENFIPQFIAEWGVPVGSAALIGLAALVRPRALGVSRAPGTAGIAAGIVALLAQNLADLGLEVPAIAIAATTALGTCWGANRAVDEIVPESERRPVPAKVVIALVLTVAATLATSLLFGMHPAQIDRREIAARFKAAELTSPEDREALWSDVRSAMAHHPADPYFPRLAAVITWSSHEEDALPWLQYALERAVESGPSHFFLANMLISKGRADQALFEMRLAATYDRFLVTRAARILTALTANPNLLLMAVPDGERGAPMLMAMAGDLRGPALAPLREGLYHEAIRRDPTLPEAHQALIGELLDALSDGTESDRCVDSRRSECALTVESEAEALARLLPTSSKADVARARLLMAIGRPKNAELLLNQRCGRVDDPAPCLHVRVEAARRAGDGENVLATAEELRMGECGEATACAGLLDWLSEQLAAVRNVTVALKYADAAATSVPTSARWLRVALLARSLGDSAKALSALTHAAQSPDADAAAKSMLEQERQRALKRSLRVE